MQYNLNQKVLIKQYDRWNWDYEIEGQICGFETAYVINGKTVYQVLTINGDKLNGIEEHLIKGIE